MGRLFLKLGARALTSLLAFHVQRTVYEWTSEKTQVCQFKRAVSDACMY